MAFKRSMKRRRAYVKRFTAGRSARRSSVVRAPVASRKRLRAIANLRTGGTLGVELKYTDTFIAAATVAQVTGATLGNLTVNMAAPAYPTGTATDIQYLNLPLVGSDARNRDGRVITNKSVEIHGRLLWTVADTPLSGPMVMIALVLDTQVNGGVANGAADNVFVNNVASAATASCLLRNLSNSSRYRVLYSRKFNMSSAVPYSSGGDDAYRVIPFSIYKKLGFKTHFTLGGSTVTPAAAMLIDNGLILLAWSDHTDCQISAQARVRFVG